MDAGGTRLDSVKAIVTHYLANRSESADRELRFYRGRRSLDEALEFAALARLPSGKRAHHQRRLSEATLEAAWAALRRCDFSRCETFDDLLRLVEETAGPIDGVGELYVYDTSVRLGAYLRLAPERVHLHAGVRRGARALGFTGGDYLECDDLPSAFRLLEPHQIEDCLCIYKRELAELGAEG